MNNIERQVMASVGVIYTARSLVGPVALKVYVLALSLWSIGRLVWVSKVFDNFAIVSKGGIESLALFGLSALTHTTVIVQFALIVAIVALVGLCIDMVRKQKTLTTFA